MHADLRFEPFDKARHDRGAFDCGVPALTAYLRTSLGQQTRRDVTRGYVLAAPDGTIAGYFTLSAGSLGVAVVPPDRGFPGRLPLPTTLLGRLAVDLRFRGQRLGEALLVHALRVAVKAADTVAAACIEVDAKDDRARSFYAKYGLASLPDDPLHMYMTMADARAAAGLAGD